MPVFNGEKTIKKAIESVINQNYSNCELIIADGLSTDNTVNIIKEFQIQANITLISEKDKGQSDATNKAFRLATGDIIGWLNADDYYTENAFSIIIKNFENNIQLLYGNCYYGDENGNIIRKFKAPEFNLKTLLEKGYCYIPSMSCFYRKTVIEKFLPNILNNDLHYAMDYDFFIRCALAGFKFKYIDEYLAVFTRGTDNKTVTNIEEMRMEGIHLALNNGAGKHFKFWINYLIAKIYFLLPNYIRNLIRKIRYKI